MAECLKGETAPVCCYCLSIPDLMLCCGLDLFIWSPDSHLSLSLISGHRRGGSRNFRHVRLYKRDTWRPADVWLRPVSTSWVLAASCDPLLLDYVNIPDGDSYYWGMWWPHSTLQLSSDTQISSHSAIWSARNAVTKYSCCLLLFLANSPLRGSSPVLEESNKIQCN